LVQDENRIHKQQLNNFKKEIETVEGQLAAAKKKAGESEQELNELRQQVEAMSSKLTDQSLGRQGETEEVRGQLVVAERERDAALEARDYMEVRQRECEADGEMMMMVMMMIRRRGGSRRRMGRRMRKS
jgi:chromosome segregation ATPase